MKPTTIGLGLFYDADTTLPLARGAFVCLYAGEYLTTMEARARWAKGLEDNYTLSLKMSYSSSTTPPRNGAMVWDGTIHIDPRRMGNIGRFLNHSCEPNCVIYLIKWGAGNTWPRAAIFVSQTARVRLRIAEADAGKSRYRSRRAAYFRLWQRFRHRSSELRPGHNRPGGVVDKAD